MIMITIIDIVFSNFSLLITSLFITYYYYYYYYYSKDVDNESKATKARGTHLRVHYKHCREIAHAILGRGLKNARQYLENVLEYKDAIPFTKYKSGIGRHSVAKKYKATGDKVSWPIKATKTFLDLITNLESNAEVKGLNIENVKITHANVNQAPKMRRRTYRAHGRINAYMSSPAHIELIGEEAADEIVKEKDVAAPKVTKKQAAIAASKKVKIGGDK